MTMTGDFTPSGDQEFGEAPSYPTVFGVTFTPLISGVLLAVVGLGSAAYITLNLLQPVWQRSQELSADVAAKTDQVQQQSANIKKVEEAKANLALAQQRQKDVLGLFADARTLDTLLIDLNRELLKRGVKFNQFTPVGPLTPITDGSLGESVNGKLKRQEFNLSIDGSFAQTQTVMRSIEQLQPLLVVKGLNTQLDKSRQKLKVDSQGRLVAAAQPETLLKTTFKLEALVPFTPEELEAAAKAAAEAAAAAAQKPK